MSKQEMAPHLLWVLSSTAPSCILNQHCEECGNWVGRMGEWSDGRKLCRQCRPFPGDTGARV